jgi:hypothetical protein
VEGWNTLADQRSGYRDPARNATKEPAAQRDSHGKRTFWVHPATLVFQRHEPPKPLETIWIAHPGWGYIRRRDLWVREECSLEDLLDRGFTEKKPLTDGDALICPYCGMYICSIPGALVKKHTNECGGGEEDQRAIETAVIDEKRIKDYERRLRETAEMEEQERVMEEKRERFDRIRSEAQARQFQKDRKKKMKEETKRGFRER